MMIKISPISVNRCWQGKRFKSKEYKTWREEFGWKLASWRGKMISKPCGLRVDFFIKNYSMVDVDNLLKPFLDVLTEYGIISDDRIIVRIEATKLKVKSKDDERISFEFYGLKN